jgi:hypothetical protein
MTQTTAHAAQVEINFVMRQCVVVCTFTDVDTTVHAY